MIAVMAATWQRPYEALAVAADEALLAGVATPALRMPRGDLLRWHPRPARLRAPARRPARGSALIGPFLPAFPRRPPPLLPRTLPSLGGRRVVRRLTRDVLR